MNKRLAAVVLAGGYSSRMGQFKPLLSLGGQTLTDLSINLFAQNQVDVYLVAGFRSEQLFSGIRNRDVHMLENPDFAQGMFTSVQAGLRRLEGDYQAFFVLPVDTPLIRPATVRRLLSAAEESPQKILYPVFNHERGHPPLVPVSLIPHILAWQNDGGLKGALTDCDDLAEEIAVADRFIHFDIDTPEDYRTALESFLHYDIPTPEECEAVLEICRVDPSRRRHMYKVAEVAERFCLALKAAGKTVDRELVRAASVLHDIAREQPQHDITGGRILEELGFEKVAAVVAVHTFLETEPAENKLEARVVFLADKFVQEDKLVTLEQRYDPANRPSGSDPAVAARIERRRLPAEEIKKDLEALTGVPLEELVFHPERNQAFNT
jgi:CTP:molybdopterin cytidylyltransferase MocA